MKFHPSIRSKSWWLLLSFPFPSFSNCWSVDCYFNSFLYYFVHFLFAVHIAKLASPLSAAWCCAVLIHSSYIRKTQSFDSRDVLHACVGKPIIYIVSKRHGDVMRALLREKKSKKNNSDWECAAIERETERWGKNKKEHWRWQKYSRLKIEQATCASGRQADIVIVVIAIPFSWKRPKNVYIIHP